MRTVRCTDLGCSCRASALKGVGAPPSIAGDGALCPPRGLIPVVELDDGIEMGLKRTDDVSSKSLYARARAITIRYRAGVTVLTTNRD